MNSSAVTGAESFPRRHALTRGFTLGAPRNFRVSADGERIAFLRSSGRSIRSICCGCSMCRPVPNAL